MASHIQLQNPDEYALGEERLKRAAQTVLDQHPAYSSASLTIVITSTETLRECNRRHRQVNAVTDVLAFAASALPEEIGQEQSYLGDILIAPEYAAVQAEAKGVGLADTLCLLVIHGTLHLLGYKHDTKDACDRMWLAQANALESLGISSAIVDRYERTKRA